ncbi:MAG: sigma-54-dependent Fis family transcriptional regulator [Proteobacteria bacterium]|nr:sigma-54-dependent Fis family transcriptional regulator [Pseudomonadota bacterium]
MKRMDKERGSFPEQYAEGLGRTGQVDEGKTISKKLLVPLGAVKLAEILLAACVNHEDVADQVRDAIVKSGLHTSAAGTGHAGEPVMVGDCEAMKAVFKAIRRFAVTNAPVLITGESGTGKELTALAIHERSPFVDGPFIAVNCSGLPASLIASELFGHEKGAFTGAVNRRTGRIEAANGGTLFLDEIGDLPLELQGNLLRFLQEKTIERVGSIVPLKVSARVIAATNVDLEAAVADGRFRRDLFFRLDVLRVRVPPLRERPEDIEVLIQFFVQQACQELGCQKRLVTARALNALKLYSWPGNIRELISKIRRGVVMAEGEMLDVADFELDGSSLAAPSQEPSSFAAPQPGSTGLADVRQDAEARAIFEALNRHHYNVSAAAKELCISRTTMYKRMSKLDISH